MCFFYSFTRSIGRVKILEMSTAVKGVPKILPGGTPGERAGAGLLTVGHLLWEGLVPLSLTLTDQKSAWRALCCRGYELPPSLDTR